MGSPTNLNEEDVVHSNSTSTNSSLIPPNHEVGQNRWFTHIRNSAHNIPVEHRAMQEVSGEIKFCTFKHSSLLGILLF